MKIQNDKKLQEIHLERLVETRWSYWHSSLKKILLHYTEIRDVLKVLTAQDDQTAKAIGLLEEFLSFNFILILHIMQQLLSSVHCLSCELQNSKILLPTATNLVNSLKDELMNKRSEKYYELIYEKAKICAFKNNIPTVTEMERNNRLRQKYKPSKQFEDYFVMSTLGKSKITQSKNTVKNIKTDVLYNVIDK